MSGTAPSSAADASGLPAPLSPIFTAPSESPFITNAAQTVQLSPPTMRRVEEAQRHYGEAHFRHRLFHEAWTRSAFALGMQGAWLGVGAWVLRRGWMYSDPSNSLLLRWAHSRPAVLRLTTPISCLGWTLMVVTAAMLPSDIDGFLVARRGLAATSEEMAKHLKELNDAYAEGRAQLDAGPNAVK